MSPGSAEVLKPLYDTLHRYAGWLDRAELRKMLRVVASEMRRVLAESQ